MQIAILDSSESNRLELEALVTAMGYQISTADSGVQHLRAGEPFAADLVLLNTGLLAECEGRVIAAIKALQPDIYLPIILIANDRDSGVLLQYLQLGADDFHTKPFDALILEAKLKAHLRTRELSQVLAEKNRKLAWHSENTQQEHRIVQNIFKNALSRNLLNYANIETFLLPHSRFNGDLYLIARGPIGNLYLMLGDFTGHGLAAAIGTLPASQTFFALAAQGAPVSQIASEINRQLQKLLPENMFCCATLVELSASGERLSWWSGGMPPAMLVGPKHRNVEFLQAQHMPLGILDEPSFSSAITLTPVQQGSKLLLYTDGAVEIGVQQDLNFGYAGFQQLCTRVDWNFTALKEALLVEIEQRGIDDDLSLVQLHCVPTEFTVASAPEQLSQLPFTIHVKLGPEDIRSIDPVAHILRGLSQLEGFKDFKPSLHTVLTEAYNNAVDHGLLGMASAVKASIDGFDDYYAERTKRLNLLQQGEVEITLQYFPKEALMRIKVCDSGTGFGGARNGSEDFPFGRGLLLIRELTETLTWAEQGRCIEFSFLLKRPQNR